jgi:hypothetical protein
MARRTRSFDVFLAKQLRSKRNARAFVLAGQEEGQDPWKACATLVRAYGIEEFVEDYEIPRASMYRFLGNQSGSWDVALRILGDLKLRLIATKDFKKAA